jgi:hypothetical protein
MKIYLAFWCMMPQTEEMNPEPQVRLDEDVAKLVAEAAKENSRTLPREVNHVLRKVYKPGEGANGNNGEKNGTTVETRAP